MKDIKENVDGKKNLGRLVWPADESTQAEHEHDEDADDSEN